MGKTKSIDTHNGGWKHDIGRKGTGAPGKKRKQATKELGKFKDFTHGDGRRFEQKVPAGQKRMMQMMKAMQQRKESGGGKEVGKDKPTQLGLDTGADSVHPDKAKRQDKAKKKKQKDDNFDPRGGAVAHHRQRRPRWGGRRGRRGRSAVAGRRAQAAGAAAGRVDARL